MTTFVGMGELCVKCGKGTLNITGLGSCVGLALYDPLHKVAGLAHVMLPSAIKSKPVANKGKYADTALPELIKMMREIGADLKQIQAKISGGAQMFAVKHETIPIGKRNVDMCKELLKQWEIPLIAEDTGGNYGRNLSFSCETGILQIRNSTIGLKEI